MYLKVPDAQQLHFWLLYISYRIETCKITWNCTYDMKVSEFNFNGVM